MLGHRFGLDVDALYSSGKLQLSLSGAGAAGTYDLVCKKSPGAGDAALCCAGTTVLPKVSLKPRTYPVYLQNALKGRRHSEDSLLEAEIALAE